MDLVFNLVFTLKQYRLTLFLIPPPFGGGIKQLGYCKGMNKEGLWRQLYRG